MEDRRVVVVTSPAYLPKEARAPLVGLFEFTTPESWVAVVVKSRIGRDPSLLRRPEFLLGTPSQADALARPADFVPLKPDVDVLLMGHVRGPRSRAPMPATLHLGERAIAVELHGDEASGRITLAAPQLTISNSNDQNQRPRNAYDGEVTEFVHKATFPWEITQTAHPSLTLDEDLPEGARLRLEAIVGSGPSTMGEKVDLFDVELPPFTARVVIDPSQSGRESFEVPMRLDTIVLDAGDDALEVELTWRGMFPCYTGVGDVDRVFLGFAREDAMDSPREGWPFLLRELPYGQFDHAWVWSDALSGIPPRALTAEETKAARYRVWNFPLSPEPRTSVEEMAAIEAAFERRNEPRSETLARYGLDEQFFAIEQRAWFEKVAAQARVTGGQPPLANQFLAARGARRLAAAGTGTDR